VTPSAPQPPNEEPTKISTLVATKGAPTEEPSDMSLLDFDVVCPLPPNREPTETANPVSPHPPR
jgi:hypothetical protein